MKSRDYFVRQFTAPAQAQRPKVGDTVTIPGTRDDLPKRKAKVIAVYPNYVLCDVGKYKECLNV